MLWRLPNAHPLSPEACQERQARRATLYEWGCLAFFQHSVKWLKQNQGLVAGHLRDRFQELTDPVLSDQIPSKIAAL